MPTLTFTQTAWNKVTSARDAVDTEIGIILIPHADDRLLIVDIAIPPQECTVVHVSLDAQGAAECFGRLEQELSASGYDDPCLAERYWLHTHPGSSADPSYTDDRDFARRQKIGYPFLIHVILAQTGEVWARIDHRIEGTDEYIETPLSVRVERMLPCQETIELAQRMVRSPKPIIRQSDPTIYVPGKRRAKRSLELATTSDAWEYDLADYLDDIPPSPLSDIEYTRWQLLDNRDIGSLTEMEFSELCDLERRFYDSIELRD